jgi:PEGA domain
MRLDRSFRMLLGLAFFILLLAPRPARATDNKVMGQLDFVPATKVEKGAGVWIDGQYVGHISELKGDKKILLLPGEHDINVRQSGYADFLQKVTVEPGKELELMVQLAKDPRVQFSKVTSEIKLHVEPDRAAVFLDGSFVGYVHEFGGVGRAMLVNPGKHEVKIALPGYRDFTAQVNLLPKQKFTIETKLLTGSISQADPAVKSE